ncbi:MAG: DUF2071 domain-containing protein [Agriterribacter sp.]
MKPFLTAEWLKLAIANYRVDPSILKPNIPSKTELDLFNDTCYVSLVGFRFWNTRVKNIAIPYHTNFEEINLRFYVRYKEDDNWKRGVVFIKEIVPRFAISFIANTLYQERYQSMPTSSTITQSKELLTVQYQWGNGLANKISMNAFPVSHPVIEGSEEEFITAHYWGYSKQKDNTTKEYKVEHPGWNIYPVKDYHIMCDFKNLYGSSFSILQHSQPLSVLLAEGSPVKVYPGKKI